jgi:hypothetical protein
MKIDIDSWLNWFDNEPKTVFGIDVFSSSFLLDKGHKIYNGNNSDMLLIKLEKLDECAKEAFNVFWRKRYKNP